MTRFKENILGYDVDYLSSSECVESIFCSTFTTPGNSLRCIWLACINPHSYVVALDDEQFKRALLDADWLVPDGAGIVLASRLLGGIIRHRVTGSDIFCGLHERMNITGEMSVFFLGSTEKTLSIIRERMAIDYPKIRVAGTYSPPFRHSYSFSELDDMINTINAAKPDVLWVGMSAPKQEKWIFDNRLRLQVKFVGAIGAVFDFYSGQVKRSHPIFQRLGFEWLPRLTQQPKRLWKRTFVSAPIFLWHIIKIKIGRTRLRTVLGLLGEVSVILRDLLRRLCRRGSSK